MTGPDCCGHPGNDELFDEATARRTADRYRRRGLLRRERRVVDLLAARGVTGARVLEVGGGVGQLQLALLDRGAASATNLELSPHYEAAASRLAREEGHADRVTRLGGDATTGVAVPRADVALAFRVLCCTDDWRSMLDTLLRSGASAVAVTLPRAGVLARAVILLDTLGRVLTRTAFRMRHHDPAAVVAHLRAAGHELAADDRGLFWSTLVAVAPADTDAG